MPLAKAPADPAMEVDMSRHSQSLVAEPIRGNVPDASIYLGASVVIGLLLVFAWPLFVRYRASVVYWL